jgi:hypothetical protein
MSHVYKILPVAVVLCLWNPVHSNAAKNSEQEEIDFRGGSSLIFSLPLSEVESKTFEPGWKRAVLINASGSEIPLFPMEFFASMSGLIFARNYSPRVSPSGKYAVLDVLRVGVVNPGPAGTEKVSSRQYCPVVDTASGCVVRVQTGDLCGGDWAEKTDEWIVEGYKYDGTDAMIRYEFYDANGLWNQFQQARRLNATATIRQSLLDSAGAANLMVCEPPNKRNRTSYSLIARQLIKEGDQADASFIWKKLSIGATDSSGDKSLIVTKEKAYLYDRPDSMAQSGMYLVKGDVVRKLKKSGDNWIEVEYVEKNGESIRKWLRSESVK